MDGTPDLESILSELADRYTYLPVQEGEFTVQMFAEPRGLSVGQAMGVLRRAIKCGEVELVVDAQRKPVKRNVGGHPTHVYRLCG